MDSGPPCSGWLSKTAAALCLVTSLILLYHVNKRLESTKEGLNYSSTIPPLFRICQKQTNIGFLKTHKCASSSVQNILMRFGVKNQLNFVLPSAGNYVGR
jgi:hypothetical protein